MLTPKMMDRATLMFTTMINKHADDLREAHFDWSIQELYDGRYGDILVQTPLPLVSLYWR